MGKSRTKTNRSEPGARYSHDARLMTPDHPGWTDFADHLHDELMTNGCSGQPDQAVRLLGNIQGVDVNKTLDYFLTMGGHCDCEIMLNVQ